MFSFFTLNGGPRRVSDNEGGGDKPTAGTCRLAGAEIAGHPGLRPRGTVAVAVLYSTSSRTPASCFYHCGSSGADIAIFDPRSLQSGATRDGLFYFMLVESMLSLPLPSFDPRSRGQAGVIAGRERAR